MFIEKDYIIAAMLSFKHNNLNEEFVKISEVDNLIKELQIKLKELDEVIAIKNTINLELFNISNEIITLNKNQTFENIEFLYKEFLPLKILTILNETNFITQSIENKDNELNKPVLK